MNSASKTAWQLLRQDDHGNEFLVDTFPTERLARQARDRLERYTHKQFYWIRLAPSSPSSVSHHRAGTSK